MKKIYVILVISFLFDSNNFAQWEQQSIPIIESINSHLSSVFFINKNIGWAAGVKWAAGWETFIIKTQDGGKNWTIQDSSFNSDKVFFVDSLHGWCISEGDTIMLKTTNGGYSWSKINLIKNIISWGFYHSIHSIFFSDTLNGWVLATYGPFRDWRHGLILKTTDGGESWTQLFISDSNINYGVYFHDVFFFNKSDGWLLNTIYYPDEFSIPYTIFLKTTNGGQTWEKPPQPRQAEHRSFSKICFSNSECGWALSGSLLIQTTDGGNNWKDKSFIYTNNSNRQLLTYYRDIKSFDNFTGWLYGYYSVSAPQYSYYYIAKTNDAGNTWDFSLDSLTTPIYAMSFPDKNNGWTVGEGTIYKYTFKQSKIDNNLWKDNISIESKIAAKTITFGQSPQASDGIDSVLGEKALHPDSSGVLDLRFSLSDSVSSVKDIRNSSENKITWKLKFQPDTSGYPITFIWNKYGLPEGTFVLKDIISKSIVNVNMKEYNSYELRDTSISSLIIEYTFNFVPVELTSFGSKILNNMVELNWKTATEKNNKGFDIQRRLNSNWEKIGYVKGNGTTTNPNEYNYKDNFKYESYKGIVSYRLKQIDLDGSFNYSDEIKLNVDFKPKEFTLYQNYPNPFNPSTTIKYALPFESSVDIMIYNMIGQRIEEYKEGIKEAGYHDVTWQPKGLSSGVYFYSINAKSTDGKNNYSKTLKMLYMK